MSEVDEDTTGNAERCVECQHESSYRKSDKVGCGNGLGVVHRTVGFLFSRKWSHGGENEEFRTFNKSFSRNLPACEEFSDPNADEG